ncbi:MAG: cytochrome ubiquinol oxidase subunit I, partial [Orrella sp.]
ILTHSTDGTVTGLDAFPRDKQPPVFMVFWSFRVMVGIGMLMILVGIWGAFKVWRGTLLDSRRYLRFLTLMIPAPFVAVLAGWFVTEIGRQPYVIYGMMTGAEGLTPSLQGWMALLTLIGYAAVYAVVFTAGLYYLRKLVNAGISDLAPTGSDTGRPKRPMSAADNSSAPSAPAFFNA